MRTPRIVLFGATGYTGRLTAEELVARGHRPLLAGRTETAVRALADELGGLPWATASAEDPTSIAALLQPGDVLLSTVGPFALHGSAAVDAALQAGAHYIDSTGEPGFIREVFGRHDDAVRAGITMLPALGYDYVPGNLAGALALQRAGSGATRVDVGYFAQGGLSFSGGTLRSLGLALLEPGYVLRGGAVLEQSVGRRLHRHPRYGGRPRASLSSSGSEQLALSRTFPRVREVNVGLGVLGPVTPVNWAALRALGPILGVETVSRRLRRLVTMGVKGSNGGPSATLNARQSTRTTGHAYDAHGRELSRVELVGPSIYTFTQRFLAWAAIRLLEQPGAPGVRGPVETFGTEAPLEPDSGLGLREVGRELQASPSRGRQVLACQHDARAPADLPTGG